MAQLPRSSSKGRGGPRAPGRQPGHGPDKSILIGLCLVLAAFWLWRKGGEKPETAQSMAAKPPIEEPIIKSDRQIQQDQHASSQRSLLLIQERAAGLTPLPVSKSEKGVLQLSVRSRAFVRGCTLSDLDIMLQDQAILKRADPGFVLSVEDLDPASPHKPLQVAVTVAELKKGFQHTFSIPVDRKRSTWGIFLCTAGREKSCQRQLKTSVGDLGLLQSDIISRQKPLSAYPAQDKVFFFHFMVAYKDRLLLHDPMQSLDSSFQRLEAALQKGGGEPVSPALLRHVKQSLRAIGSLPALVKGPVLELQLPHRGDRCL